MVEPDPVLALRVADLHLRRVYAIRRGHGWFDMFGDTLCAYCGVMVWDDAARRLCVATPKGVRARDDGVITAPDGSIIRPDGARVLDPEWA